MKFILTVITALAIIGAGTTYALFASSQATDTAQMENCK